MAYLEELLPEFRKGAKIRRSGLRKPANAKGYIFYDEGKIYNEFGKEVEPDLGLWLSKNDWEFYKEPEPDWQYIIDNKCLCWFWDGEKEENESMGILVEYRNERFNGYRDSKGTCWNHGRPVRRDEVNFYEDRKDD